MRNLVERLVERALREACADKSIVLDDFPEDLGIERPKDQAHGDWATSLALRLAKSAHSSPRTLAEILLAKINAICTADKDSYIKRVEIAGPGFINFTLSASAWQQVFRQVHDAGADYGRTCFGKACRVNLEFISANPTGPMHLGHARWAATGDALARTLSFCGYEVTREFYVNDAGRQMEIFAQSINVRYVQIARLVQSGMSTRQALDHIVAHMDSFNNDLPENCYAGTYVVSIAATIYDTAPITLLEADEDLRIQQLKEIARDAVLAHLKDVLRTFGLEFDVWYSERSTYKKDASGSSRLTRVLAELEKKGCLYEKDGATWFKTSKFGDDKDRVLIKSDGTYTYFASDIAYHKNKFDRGFNRCIDILGADHHGYVKRMQALGFIFGHPGQPELIIGQLVNLFRGAKRVRMSKRTGEMFTFEELLDEVGVDATRYIMLSRSCDQEIDFDIALARQQNSSNPVYYVQYAHARICSIEFAAASQAGVHFHKSESDSVSESFSKDTCISDIAAQLINEDSDLSLLVADPELALARKLDEFGDLVASCARDLAPFRLTHYAEDLAACFHQFYTQLHVLCDDYALRDARLYLIDAVRQVLENTLALLGVSAPQHM